MSTIYVVVENSWIFTKIVAIKRKLFAKVNLNFWLLIDDNDFYSLVSIGANTINATHKKINIKNYGCWHLVRHEELSASVDQKNMYIYLQIMDIPSLSLKKREWSDTMGYFHWYSNEPTWCQTKELNSPLQVHSSIKAYYQRISLF